MSSGCSVKHSPPEWPSCRSAAGPGRWSPATGLHLVLARERTPAAQPGLGEVRAAVANEWRAARREEANRAFYDGLRANYEVTVERPSWAGERLSAVAEPQ